jgi:hypothetical protein
MNLVMTAAIFNALVIGMTPAYLREIEKRRRPIVIKMARREKWHRQ